MFVVSLAVADFTVCSIYGLSIIYISNENGWYLDPRICVSLAVLVVSTVMVSNMLMTFIAINRYCLVVKGLSTYRRVFTKNSSILMVCAAWMWGILFIIPPLVGFGQFGFDEGLNCCLLPNTVESNRDYWVLMLSVGFGFPVTVSTFCYVQIYRVVRGSRLKVQQETAAAGRENSRRKADVKLTKDLFVMYGVFCICTIPNAVARVTDQEQVVLPRIVHSLIGVAMWSNSVWNPMLLSLRNKEFRTAIYASLSSQRIQQAFSVSKPSQS